MKDGGGRAPMSPSDVSFYDDMGDEYAGASLRWWGAALDQTLRLADLARGEDALDVGCGPGELTVRAAQAVADGGTVLGIDRSARMLQLARQRAVEGQVDNVEFARADVDLAPWRPPEYDVILSAFALQEAADAAAVLARLWEMLRPGGRLVVSVFGRKHFAPLIDPYLTAVAREGVAVDALTDWRRLEDPEVLDAVLADAAVSGASVTTGVCRIPLSAGLAEWGAIVRLSPLARVQQLLSPDAAARVEEVVATWAEVHDVTELELGVVHAVATKSRRTPASCAAR